MPRVSFVLSPSQPYALRELAETLVSELAEQDVPAAVTLGAIPEPEEGAVAILMNPSGYRGAEGAEALPAKDGLRRMIAVCERAPVAGEEEGRELLADFGTVFATDQREVAALHRQGIRGRLLRAGYARRLDRYDAEAERPIDVLVLGERTERRARWLEEASARLPGVRIEAQLPERLPRADEPDAPLAAPRWNALAQAKLVVLVHSGDHDRRFAWREALDAIHAGAVVVSEHSHGITPLEPGRHLFVASPQALPDVAGELLRDVQRQARARAEAYERLRSWIPYALWVSVLRAAVVERVGEPVVGASSLAA